MCYVIYSNSTHLPTFHAYVHCCMCLRVFQHVCMFAWLHHGAFSYIHACMHDGVGSSTLQLSCLQTQPARLNLGSCSAACADVTKGDGCGVAYVCIYIYKCLYVHMCIYAHMETRSHLMPFDRPCRARKSSHLGQSFRSGVGRHLFVPCGVVLHRAVWSAIGVHGRFLQHKPLGTVSPCFD